MIDYNAKAKHYCFLEPLKRRAIISPALFYLAILCVLRELRKSLVIPDRIEVMNSGFFNALRIVSRDTALDRGPPSPPQSSSKIDYQIDCQRSFTCKSKINSQKSIIRNRSSKIDFILDAHAN